MAVVGAMRYAVPAVDLITIIGVQSPNVYKRLEKLPINPRSGYITKLYKDVLTKENVQGAQYQERVQELLEDLPKGTIKDIDELLKCRIKIVEEDKVSSTPMYADGTDLDKHYVVLPKLMSTESKDALNFFAIHELGHILAEDTITKRVLYSVVGLVTALFCHVVLGAPVLLSIVAVLAVKEVASVVFNHYKEYRADDFAIKHSSVNDMHKAVVAFQRHDNINKQRMNLYQCIKSYRMHPPLASRIARIENAIAIKEKAAPQSSSSD